MVIEVKLAERGKDGFPKNEWWCHECGGNDTNVVKFAGGTKICTKCINSARTLVDRAILALAKEGRKR